MFRSLIMHCSYRLVRTIVRSSSASYNSKLHLQDRICQTNPFTTLKQEPRLKEAVYAHFVMEQLPQYKTSLATSLKIEAQNHKQNPCLKFSVGEESDMVFPLNGLFAVFVQESINSQNHLQRLQDERFTQLCKGLSRDICRLSDEQLLAALHFLSFWGTMSPTDNNFITVWNALDIECMRRLKKWGVKRCLLIADLWFLLKLNRITGYNKTMINHLGNLLDDLTSHELVQLLFYITLQRTCDKKTMIRVEEKLEQHITTLTAEELSVVALSFFKTQNMVQSETLLHIILNRLMSELETLHECAAVSFAKFLRYSGNKFLKRGSDIWPIYDSLLNACIPKLNSWSAIACTHFALLTTSILFDHEKFFSAVTMSLQSRLSELRLKDLASFLHCLAKFDRAPRPNSKFYVNVIKELESNSREEELKLYPDCLISCLANLTYCSVFPKKLISKSLSQDFFREITDTTSKDYRELFYLDCTVAIELPTYSGNRLSPFLSQKFWQMYRGRIPEQNTHSLTFLEGLLIEVQSLLSSILGANKAVIYSTLPHFNFSDIVLRTSDQQFVNVDKLMPDMSFNLPSNDGKWHCIVIGHRSCYSANTKRLLGYAKTKKRHLETIGYNVIEIPWFEYSPLSMTGKRRYLNTVLKKINP